jgi:multidrug resistance efflux pump
MDTTWNDTNTAPDTTPLPPAPPESAQADAEKKVKVVQRIPILIRFDEQPDVALRPGMSAFATVHTSTESR